MEKVTMKKTNQTERLANVFLRNTGKPLTTPRLSTLAKVPVNSLYRRIHTLRQTGLNIQTQVKTVKGQRKYTYVMSA
jgi:hypothetical protein